MYRRVNERLSSLLFTCAANRGSLDDCAELVAALVNQGLSVHTGTHLVVDVLVAVAQQRHDQPQLLHILAQLLQLEPYIGQRRFGSQMPRLVGSNHR